MARIPLRPCRKPSQTDAAFCPRALSVPMPLITVRREDAAMLHLHRALSTLACASGWCCLGPRQTKEMLQLAAKDEVVLAEDLLRTRLVKMGKEDLGLSHQLLTDEDLASNGSPLCAKSDNLARIDQFFSAQPLAVEASSRDLRQDALLTEVVGLADQNAAGLRQSLQDQRARHDRVTGKVLGEVVFRQAQVLHGAGRLAA